MKKLLIVLCLILVGVTGFFTWVYENTKPVSNQNSISSFLILKGAAASVVGNDLQHEGLIRSSLVYKLYLYANNKQRSIVPGEYSLSPNMSLVEIVNQLTKGPQEIWVTIPEGLRREEIAQKFATSFGKDQTFVDEFLTASSGKEGYLFPDTYLFPKDASPSAVVTKMLDTFDKKVPDITHDQLVMASLIERETRGAAERPIVAGILYKRIEIGMPLQVDASIQYITGKPGNYWPVVLLDDRQIKSAFNTYLNLGLPPAPIANPGLSAMNAAINPQVSDYLYYLHDDKGVIHYAVTLAEHNANIKKYLGG
jgi:UPF0755 protein